MVIISAMSLPGFSLGGLRALLFGKWGSCRNLKRARGQSLPQSLTAVFEMKSKP